MKYLALGLLSSALVSGAVMAPAAKAQTVEVTPAQLVTLAQDGYLQDQGIPNGSRFVDEVQAGRVTPHELVQAAINDGRLTANTLNNQTYLTAVQTHIRSLTSDSRDHNSTGQNGHNR